MKTRSLVPWLLTGALLASGYFNLAGRSARPQSPPTTHVSGDIPAYHLGAGSLDERCPTLDLLELSKQQRDQIRKCSLTSLDVRAGLAVEVDTATAELQELLSKDAIESSRVLALTDRISELRSRQYRAWIGSILVVQEVLSAEQRKRLRELQSK